MRPEMQQSSDAEQLAQAGTVINRFVWLVALVVMVFSAVEGAALLAGHGVLWGLGLAGGLAVDAALVVALIGDRQLHRYGQRSGWGTALRWVTALMSVVLNCGRSAEHGDWVAAGLHAIFPVLLIVLTEASQGYQLAFARAVSKARVEREYRQPESVSDTATTSPIPAVDTSTNAPTSTGSRSVPAAKRTNGRPTERTVRKALPASSTARPAAGGWDERTWSRAVDVVADYQRRQGRAPKLGEFHTDLRMSRNNASPLRNAVLAAIAAHGPEGAKTTAAPGPTQASGPAPASPDTGGEVVRLHSDTDQPADTAPSGTERPSTEQSDTEPATEAR